VSTSAPTIATGNATHAPTIKPSASSAPAVAPSGPKGKSPGGLDDRD
jgi:hypothetical protein